MDSTTIRQQFIDYFEKTLAHTVIPSAPVIPQNDPTLLFTNAGMNQFKPYFLGELQPAFDRAVNSQKCIRVSGKHNDLEEVGRDHHHHTFFEMLGSWSFGDYYKKEAISWAWTLFTEIWGMDPRRLYATVYMDDDEAFKIWETVPGINPKHILKFGEKDNFWAMGDIGPCGPCSEIHYYSGDDIENQDLRKINTEDPEYIELWNLVFMQYNRDAEGKLQPLKNKYIDTGAGFERIVTVLTGKKSNYETDLFKPIIEQIETLTNIAYNSGNDGIPHRVIADHIRMLAVAISDGAIPGNEGRSYVLRRILRRAARFGRTLHLKDPFLYRLVPTVVHILGDIYPELVAQREHIQRIVRAEEESFGNTLDKGLKLFEQLTKEAKKIAEKTLNSEDVFRLYDTYGFPVDLTRLLAEEKQLGINDKEINALMEEQRERARSAGKFKMKAADELDWVILQKDAVSVFAGYDVFEVRANLIKYAFDGKFTYLVFDSTPFYAESGGQIGDKGGINFHVDNINTPTTYDVIDTQKSGEDIAHIIKGNITENILRTDKQVLLWVNKSIRLDTARNHSATHLLHAAMQKVLGEHTHQAGSYVGADRLRFDFTHFEKVSPDKQMKIQNIVNEIILQNIPVKIEEKQYLEAVSEGAQALFGEKYGDVVRVVNMGDISQELCGGTHVDLTGDIGLFFIVSESSVASGVRRIEAITGHAAMDILEKQQTVLAGLRETLRTPEKNILERIFSITAYVKTLEKENIELKAKLLTLDIDQYFQNKRSYKNATLYINRVQVENMDQLKILGDKVREKMKSGIAVFGTVIGDTPQVLCVVSDDLVKEGIKAGNIVRDLGKALGGGGGGKPHMATAGGKDASKLNNVLENIQTILS